MNTEDRKESMQLETQWVVNFRLFVLNFQYLKAILIYFFKQLLCCFGLFTVIPEKNIEGQLTLITGAANGIGRGLSTEFAKRRCNLALVDIDEKNGKLLAEELSNTYNIKTKFYKVDISIYSEYEKLKASVEKDLGFVDILVNNAGLIPDVQTLNPIRKPEDMSKLIDVNVKAHLWGVTLFLPGMKERKHGHIVATCSLGGLSASPYILDYIASKGAVKYFMDSLYYESIIKGFDDIIKTSVIFPSLVLTSNSVIKTIRDTKSFRLMLPWSVEKAGREGVKGVLQNKRYIILPPVYKFLSYFSLMPDGAGRDFFKTVLHVDHSRFKGETEQLS